MITNLNNNWQVPTFSEDTATMLINLSESYLSVSQSTRAESALTKALEIFTHEATSDTQAYLQHVARIHQTLSGIYRCQGRKKEAREEERLALRCKEALLKLKSETN